MNSNEVNSNPMLMSFWMAMKPPKTTHQTKKTAQLPTGQVVHYEDAKLTAARDKLMAHLSQHRPPAPHLGALRCITKWCFPMPKSGDWLDGDWKPTRPDAHNLNKLLFDCMTDLKFWNDDSQVASEIIEKFYAAQPGIFIQIIQL